VPNSWGKVLLGFTAMLSFSAGLSWASEAGDIEFGLVRTDSDSSAVGACVDFVPSIGEIFENTQNGFWSINPDIELRNGSKGAFDSIMLKLTGFRCSSRTIVSPDGIPMLDLDNIIVIPISIGIETNRSFSAINALGEIGCVPWFGRTSSDDFFRRLAENSQIGVFIQSGYQFSSVAGDSTGEGGSADKAIDESEGGLLRIRGSVRTEPTIISFDSSNGISIAGSAEVWYSPIESEAAARLTAGMKIDLPDKFYLAVEYEHGSGAPSFTEGDQIGLKIGFRY
jgi:hypothetical protein